MSDRFAQPELSGTVITVGPTVHTVGYTRCSVISHNFFFVPEEITYLIIDVSGDLVEHSRHLFGKMICSNPF